MNNVILFSSLKRGLTDYGKSIHLIHQILTILNDCGYIRNIL